jgi:hypothetical protein
MKISIDIDCTPREARSFLGLPDLDPVNKVITDSLTTKMQEHVDTLSDPVRFWERAMTTGGQSLEVMQAAFAQATKASTD